MKLLVGILATLIALSNWTAAQNVDPNMNAPYAYYLYAQGRLHDPRSFRAAYVILGTKARLQYEEKARGRPFTPDEQRQFIDRFGGELLRNMSPTTWRGGYMELIAKGSAGAAGAAAANKLKIPVEPNDVRIFTDPLVEKLVASFDTPGTTPNLDPNQVIVTNSYALQVAYDGKSTDPFANLYRKLVRDELEAPETTVELMNNPGIVQRALLDSIISQTGKSKEVLKEILAVTLENRQIDYNKAAAAMAKALSESSLVTDLHKFLQGEKDKAKLESDRRELTAGFGTLSSISTLLGSNEAATRFDQFGQLTNAVHQFYTEDQTPTTTLDFYVMAIVALKNLTAPTKGGINPDAAILAELQKIQVFLFDFRREVNVRFDIIDRRMNDNFDRILNRLEGADAGQDLIRQLVFEVDRNLRNLNDRVVEGFTGAADFDFVRSFGECFHYDKDNTPVPLSDPNDFRSCRNYFAAVASGQFPYLNLARGGLEVPEALSPRSAAIMKMLVAAKYGDVAGDRQLVSPQLWLAGAIHLYRLGSLNPELKAIFMSSGDDALIPVQSVIKAGRDIDSFIRGLLLISTNGAYTLDAAPINALVKQYKDSIDLALAKADLEIKKSMDKGGPHPGLGIKQPPPVAAEENNTYQFVGAPIPFCTDAYKPLVIRRQFPYEADDPGNHERVVRSSYQPDKIRFSFPLVQLIPSSALWAYRTRTPGDFKLEPCMSVASADLLRIPRWRNGKMKRFDSEYKFVLDIYARIRDEGQSYRRLKIASGVATRSFRQPIKDLYSKSYFQKAWNVGWRESDAIAVNPTFYFRSVRDKRVAADLAEFEDILRKETAAELVVVRDAVMRSVNPEKVTTSNIRDALALAVGIGLDGSSEEVVRLLEFAGSPSNLPDAETVATLAVGEGVPSKILKRLIEIRVDILRAKVHKIAMSQELRPRPFSPYLQVVEKLESLAPRR
ncbi:hypothetical protein ACDY97_26850 [Rhizobium mongolense]|uniref:hypothetical protein n=1 Tax=Rhizobium mongolense TaxID=57676 RepID=UPI0035589E10